MSEPPDERPAISLVVPTRGRGAPLTRLLDSLALQAGPRFEVIVVDQNEDERVTPLLAGPWPFALRHIRRPADSGASRARNVGWRAATAPLLLFPDDDCWYAPDFLARGFALMERLRVDILTGRSIDSARRTINGRYAAHAGTITPRGVWTRQIEWITLVRRDWLDRLGGYDETIGVGADTPWQAGEGPDLIVRAIGEGAACHYDPDLTAFHDELPARHPDEAMIAKGRAYGRGMGRVLRQRGFPPTDLAYWVARAVGGLLAAGLSKNRPRARYWGNVVAGRIEGYMGRCR